MRTHSFLDWFLELLLLALFCGAVTLAEYAQHHTTSPFYNDTIQTMWWVAGGWVGCGLIRTIWHKSAPKQ